MALLDTIRERHIDLLHTVGKQALNILFPNDFEYYMIAFELVDSKGRTIDYLTFPILPDSFQEVKNERTTIKESAGGITSIGTSRFIPRDITIRGNFGRSFKFLINDVDFSFTGLRFSTMKGIYKKEDMNNNSLSLPKLPFSAKIKTGYGVLKILESIIDKANSVDSNNEPMLLYFYNPMLGNSYLVEPRNLTFDMDKSSNMIWNYNLSMTAIGPVNALNPNGFSMIRGFSFDFVQKEVLKLRNSIKVNIT